MRNNVLFRQPSAQAEAGASPALKRRYSGLSANFTLSKMSTRDTLPNVGQIVAVRQRLYLVEQSVPPVNPGDSPLVRLSCVDDDAQGQTLDVLWDIEPDARAHESDRWQVACDLLQWSRATEWRPLLRPGHRHQRLNDNPLCSSTTLLE